MWLPCKISTNSIVSITVVLAYMDKVYISTSACFVFNRYHSSALCLVTLTNEMITQSHLWLPYTSCVQTNIEFRNHGYIIYHIFIYSTTPYENINTLSGKVHIYKKIASIPLTEIQYIHKKRTHITFCARFKFSTSQIYPYPPGLPH